MKFLFHYSEQKKYKYMYYINDRCCLFVVYVVLMRSITFRHTVCLILQGYWGRVKNIDRNHLALQIEKCKKYISSNNCRNITRCTGLQKILQDPWGEPTFKKINCGDVNISDEECKYFLLFIYDSNYLAW